MIVLESSTYPGTTRQQLLPVLEKSGLVHGRDFFLAYSPERLCPGEKEQFAEIPKLVGGLEEESMNIAVAFFSNVIHEVHRVSSAEVAEASKLLENAYRAINIAFVFELKPVFARLGIDIWEVINAAKTKQFGFAAGFIFAHVFKDGNYIFCLRAPFVHLFSMLQQIPLTKI